MSGSHINPDHFLQTEAGRVITPERNARAWEQSYQAFDEALLRATHTTTLYVLVGPQGAGKSTWARELINNDARAIVFDAILVKRSEREPILRAARAHHVSSVAVWFRTPLETCLARNAARPKDEVVLLSATYGMSMPRWSRRRRTRASTPYSKYCQVSRALDTWLNRTAPARIPTPSEARPKILTLDELVGRDQPRVTRENFNEFHAAIPSNFTFQFSS